MASLHYSDRAEADLLDIWLSLAVHNRAAADRVLDRVRSSCGLLQRYPRLGRAHPEIAAGARMHVVERRWLILYRVEGTTVRVLGVVDGVRDLRNRDWLE